MSQGLILSLMNQSMYEILILSIPLLGAAMVIGLIISILQATTMIQEQTLTFVPKMIVIILLMVFIGPFLLNHLMDFTYRMFDLIAQAKM